MNGWKNDWTNEWRGRDKNWREERFQIFWRLIIRSGKGLCNNIIPSQLRRNTIARWTITMLKEQQYLDKWNFAMTSNTGKTHDVPSSIHLHKQLDMYLPLYKGINGNERTLLLLLSHQEIGSTITRGRNPLIFSNVFPSWFKWSSCCYRG